MLDNNESIIDNTNNNTNGAAGQTDNVKRTFDLPKHTQIPQHMRKFLGEITVPDKKTIDWQIDIGEKLLEVKQRYTEEENLDRKSGKLPFPHVVDFKSAALTLTTIHTFKNIQMTDREGDVVLGLYIDDKNSKHYGTYKTDERVIINTIEHIAPDAKDTDMTNIISKIQRIVESVEPTANPNLHPVSNGIYDKASDELLDFSPEYVYLTKIPVNYIDNPENPIIEASDGYKWDVESWIAELMDNDEERIKLIWQVIADSLQPNHSRNKSIWFYSEKGNNGKGTLGQLIKNLLGKGNYASLSVEDFRHEYLKETLIDTAANISDENDVDVYIDSVKDFKASITGDDININRKYEKPIRMKYTGANIQMLNSLPKTQDRSESFYRRLIIVPFLKSFTNNGERPYIKDDYIARQEVLEYVMHKALHIEFDDYIIPKASAEVMHEYRERNNPVMDFWNELKDEFVWDLLPTQFLYDLYAEWISKNNPNSKLMGKRTFVDNLISVIDSQNDGWLDKTKNPIASSGKMDADEPIISEYGLDKPDRKGKMSDWMNPSNNTTLPSKQREFPRKQKYRGFLRV